MNAAALFAKPSMMRLAQSSASVPPTRRTDMVTPMSAVKTSDVSMFFAAKKIHSTSTRSKLGRVDNDVTVMMTFAL